jgi:hypothetical protein
MVEHQREGAREARTCFQRRRRVLVSPDIIAISIIDIKKLVLQKTFRINFHFAKKFRARS